MKENTLHWYSSCLISFSTCLIRHMIQPKNQIDYLHPKIPSMLRTWSFTYNQFGMRLVKNLQQRQTDVEAGLKRCHGERKNKTGLEVRRASERQPIYNSMHGTDSVEWTNGSVEWNNDITTVKLGWRDSERAASQKHTGIGIDMWMTMWEREKNFFFVKKKKGFSFYVCSEEAK
jgi:hypothetical protein